MERILVGIDGSPAAHDVLEWSANLAGRANLDLVAARVFVSTQAELPPGEDADLHDDQLQELDAWCATLPAATSRPRTVLIDGSPPDALLAAVHEQHADLLAVGGRGSGGFSHLHLGSVAHHLTHRTTVPLAIVPRTGSAPSNTSSSESTAHRAASPRSTSAPSSRHESTCPSPRYTPSNRSLNGYPRTTPTAGTNRPRPTSTPGPRPLKRRA